MQGIYQNITISDSDVKEAEKYLCDQNTSLLVIMFTDIQGSTLLTEKLGDLELVKVLKEHDSILLPIISKHNGIHIKSIVDSIMAVFSKPSLAVECALKIQEELNKYPPFKIRIGMDMGEVAEEKSGGVTKDVFGRFVNRAARIVNLAEGGHILVTDQIQDSATAWISDVQVKWYYHGKHMVRGVEKPLSIWEPYNTNTVYPMQFQEIHMEQERKWTIWIFRRPRTEAKLTHHNSKIAQLYVAPQQQTLEAWRIFDFQRDITMNVYVQEVLKDLPGFSPLGSVSKLKPRPIPEREILQCISGDIEKYDQVCIIVGRAGSGKSTMLRNWTLSLIAEHKKNIAGKLLPTPIYLSLRHLSSSIHEGIDGEITSSNLAKCLSRTIPALEDKDAELLFSRIQTLRSKKSIVPDFVCK